MNQKDINLGILGLGYVGLPLAIEFAKKRNVIAFDINKKRVEELKEFKDTTLESTSQELKDAKYLHLTNDLNDLVECNCFIVTVPTPINSFNKPDLSAILRVTKDISKILKKGDTVIYESTVYPGLTEEICVPILEENSKLIFNKDFYCGYSPERINPGDKNHRLVDIKKVTSGSNEEISLMVDSLYRSIIKAGTYRASSIKVAEAAKVIENTQRDLNIALMNELSIIFNIMNIDTNEVLEAASTKWNFLPFKPGLVGGHCIGVDPYYLTYKSQQLGYDPKIILSGRELNDHMTDYIISVLLKMIKVNFQKSIEEINILMMGLTFKENCPDTRNSKCINMANSLNKLGFRLDCYDPWVESESFEHSNKLNCVSMPKKDFYDVIILSVSHQEFIDQGVQDIKNFGNEKHIFFDLKSVFPKEESSFRL